MIFFFVKLEVDMLIHPGEAEPLKRAVDATYPAWRQYPYDRSETPALVVIDLEGKRFVLVSGSSIEAFGAGHLLNEEWWRKGGIGAALKCSTLPLDELNVRELPGFIHIHRFSCTGEPLGPRAEAEQFFRNHRSEYSAFYRVLISQCGSERYPWRAKPA